jgi:hypothetical protein
MAIKKNDKATKHEASLAKTVGNHICFVVKDRDKTVQTLSSIFGITYWLNNDKQNNRSVKTAWGNLEKFGLDRLWIEVLEPLGDEGPINKFLKNKGEGIYHLSMLVQNWDELVEVLKKKEINITIKSNEAGGLKECAFEVTHGGPIIEIKNDFVPDFITHT